MLDTKIIIFFLVYNRHQTAV